MIEAYPKTLLEFERRFASEELCREYLARLRWPDGFVCPSCAAREYSIVRRGRWRCRQCTHEVSVTAGTIFQDSKLPLMLWFRAMWQVTSQKNGVSAVGLQRVLGLGSYKTAWTMMHKLRRAMIRPGREQLSGTVEVDETYYGPPAKGLTGRQLGDEKALIIVAVEIRRRACGRIRMRVLPAADRVNLHRFVSDEITTGSVVRTDGFAAYDGMKGVVHDPRPQIRQAPNAEHVLPRAHRIISLLKRWLLGTHQGAVALEYLPEYLEEFVFRFNRRASATRGKLFYRLAQQAVLVSPATFDDIANHNR